MRKQFRVGLLLLCALAITLRVSGMHMHVDDAHDGPAGIHLAEVGGDRAYHQEHDDHDGHAVGEHRHVSIDVGLNGDALSKQATVKYSAIAWLPPLLMWLPLTLQPRRQRIRPQWRPPPSVPRLVDLLPPLRGPPLHA